MKKRSRINIQFLIVLISIFQTSTLFALKIPITGILLDSETKAPLPYASIIIKGKHKATVSNSEGVFVLEREGISLEDTIQFLYMGYETIKMTVSAFEKATTLYMLPQAMDLEEVRVLSRTITAEEIIKKAHANFEKNHSIATNKQRIFLHIFEKVPFQKENKINLKETNFVGLDKKTVEELLKKMPKEFVDYQDAIVDLYSNESKYKLIPVKGISLEEGSQKELMQEFEDKLSVFAKDIEKSIGEKDIYYKIRTGILSKKLGNKNKDKEEWNKDTTNYENDSLNYTIQTIQVKDYFSYLLKNYATKECDNWEFINSTRKYDYVLEDIVDYNNELIYKISFTPEKKGLFVGTVYISTSSFAILQLDFSFDEGKKSDNFNLLGFKHSTDYKEGHIIFEKGSSGYFAKYISVKQKEFTSINRDFAIMKKQKRLLMDKELNEFKIEVELFFYSESHWEFLVLDREEIALSQFEKVIEPVSMKFKKEYSYSPDIWENGTIIVPTNELKKYIRE